MTLVIELAENDVKTAIINITYAQEGCIKWIIEIIIHWDSAGLLVVNSLRFYFKMSLFHNHF